MIAAMDNGTLQAQELVQKGAIDALQMLQLLGVDEINVNNMLHSLRRLAKIISKETKRRGLCVVDVSPPIRPGQA
jgi:hypothetical protein